MRMIVRVWIHRYTETRPCHANINLEELTEDLALKLEHFWY